MTGLHELLMDLQLNEVFLWLTTTPSKSRA